MFQNGWMSKPWMIDELAHAGPEHLDRAFVAAYDRKQGEPDLAQDIAVFVGHDLASNAIIVDLGAGTGRFALAAARRFGHVTAVDVSPVMLEHLHERAIAAGLANLDCVQAGFLSYDHTGPLADGVFTRNALHHLPDFWKGLALDRIGRMMRPGGVLRVRDLIYDCSPSEVDEVFDRWLDSAARDPLSGYTRSDLEEHIRAEHSTYRWLFERMLEATGFEIETAEFSGRTYGAYTCAKR